MTRSNLGIRQLASDGAPTVTNNTLVAIVLVAYTLTETLVTLNTLSIVKNLSDIMQLQPMQVTLHFGR